jgi:hypothetical protein
LEPHEKEVLQEVIDQHLEGIDDAREATITDKAIDTPEMLNDLMAGYHDTVTTLESIKEKLC